MMNKKDNKKKCEVDEMIGIDELDVINGGAGGTNTGTMVLYMQIVAKITGKRCPGCNTSYHQLSTLNSTDLKELGNGRVRCPKCNKYYAWTQFK